MPRNRFADVAPTTRNEPGFERLACAGPALLLLLGLGDPARAQAWTIPLNLSFGKTVILSGRPWKLSAEINYFVEQPDAFGPRWFFGVSLAPVIENPLSKLFQ